MIQEALLQALLQVFALGFAALAAPKPALLRLLYAPCIRGDMQALHLVYIAAAPPCQALLCIATAPS